MFSEKEKKNVRVFKVKNRFEVRMKVTHQCRYWIAWLWYETDLRACLKLEMGGNPSFPTWAPSSQIPHHEAPLTRIERPIFDMTRPLSIQINTHKQIKPSTSSLSHLFPCSPFSFLFLQCWRTDQTFWVPLPSGSFLFFFFRICYSKFSIPLHFSCVVLYCFQSLFLVLKTVDMAECSFTEPQSDLYWN